MTVGAGIKKKKQKSFESITRRLYKFKIWVKVNFTQINLLIVLQLK